MMKIKKVKRSRQVVSTALVSSKGEGRKFFIYKVCSQIPKGYVSTYKLISLACFKDPNLARFVGNTLSKCICKGENAHEFNCSNIHCYRVIRSDFHIGKLIYNGKNRPDIKIRKLAEEKITFDEKYYLSKKQRKTKIFRDFVCEINHVDFIKTR